MGGHPTTARGVALRAETSRAVAALQKRENEAHAGRRKPRLEVVMTGAVEASKPKLLRERKLSECAWITSGEGYDAECCGAPVAADSDMHLCAAHKKIACPPHLQPNRKGLRPPKWA